MTAAIRRRPENLTVGLLVSAVGGFLDAHTYVGHGGVFANAQTGNVVLLAIALGRGRFDSVFSHVVPLVAFLLGLVLAEVLARPGARRTVRRPTRVVLLVEVAVLVVCGALALPDRVVTTAISLVAALQVSTFRTLHDVPYNTTMTTGNLRSLVGAAARWVTGERAARASTLTLAAVILAFALGAAVGAVLTASWGIRAAWVPAAALLAVLGFIVVETVRRERVDEPPA